MLLRKEGRPVNPEKRIIFIEPTAPPETRKLRVAAYIRVSTDSTDQLNSFTAQANYYTALIAGKAHWELADLYADESVTGTSAEKRPEFQRMLEDCRKGRIDKILTKSVSRFARNAKECLETVRELKARGISVHFEEQNIDSAKVTGELLTSIFAGIAQTESESISANTRWGFQTRMKTGTYIPSFLPLGYRREGGRIVLDPESAPIVRRIFAEYLSGASSVEIAAALTEDGIPSRFGHTVWQPTTVRSILSNEKYTGNSLWQKTYRTETLPFEKRRNRGERPQFYAENTHPPIISAEAFQAVRQRMAQYQRTQQPSADHPLRKKLICGNCGAVFRRKDNRGIISWSCIGHDNKDRVSCEITPVAEAEIHAAFLRLYHKLRWHGETILGELIAALLSISERQARQNEDIVTLNRRISDLKDQSRMLAEMNASGLIGSDLFISQSNLVTTQLGKAKAEKRKLLTGCRDDTVNKTESLLELMDSLPTFLPCFDGEIFTDLVEHIAVRSNTELRFHLINGLELTERIERTERR
ncbi:MAG: recombinase family protein [Clostridia bacterium]|nr:recombinase family protein [Clostridia bacterium]